MPPYTHRHTPSRYVCTHSVDILWQRHDRLMKGERVRTGGMAVFADYDAAHWVVYEVASMFARRKLQLLSLKARTIVM